MGPFSAERSVRMLIGHAPQRNEPALLHWSTASPLEQCKEDCAQIGSLTTYHADVTQWAFGVLARRRLHPDTLFPLLAGLIQSYGLRDAMMQHGVGGTVFGLRVQDGAYAWQEDTNYLLYSPADLDSNRIDWLKVCVRDDALAVSSSLTRQTRVFSNSVSTPDPDAWISKWETYVSAALTAGPGKNWLLLDTLNKVVCLVRQPYPAVPSRYVVVHQRGEGRFDLGLRSDLVKELKKIPQDRSDGSMMFRFKALVG
jgi:hypothetical protein